MTCSAKADGVLAGPGLDEIRIPGAERGDDARVLHYRMRPAVMLTDGSLADHPLLGGRSPGGMPFPDDAGRSGGRAPAAYRLGVDLAGFSE